MNIFASHLISEGNHPTLGHGDICIVYIQVSFKMKEFPSWFYFSRPSIISVGMLLV